MRTARTSSHPGGSAPGTPPGTRHHPPLWTEFLTHACENITLPQTSFAGGDKVTGSHALILSLFFFTTYYDATPVLMQYLHN